jgi:hypothetical protein
MWRYMLFICVRHATTYMLMMMPDRMLDLMLPLLNRLKWNKTLVYKLQNQLILDANVLYVEHNGKSVTARYILAQQFNLYKPAHDEIQLVIMHRHVKVNHHRYLGSILCI